MTWAAARHRQHELAERCLEAGLTHCHEPDYDLWRLHLLGYRASLQLEQGRWDESAESAHQALQDPRSSPLPRIHGLVALGLIRARRGDPGVWSQLDEAQALAEPSGELQRLVPVAAARAEAAWLMGDATTIVTATSSAYELAKERGAPWPIGQLACWRRRGGLEEGLDLPLADPYRLELEGSPEAAGAAWEKLGCPYEAALAFAQSGEESACAARTSCSPGSVPAGGRDRGAAAAPMRRSGDSAGAATRDPRERGRADSP